MRSAEPAAFEKEEVCGEAVGEWREEETEEEQEGAEEIENAEAAATGTRAQDLGAIDVRPYESISAERERERVDISNFHFTPLI